MEAILFAIYLLLFTWIVTRIKFFTDSGISKSNLSMLFLLKVIVGIIYGWISIYDAYSSQTSDTWANHFASLKETQLLFSNPSEYFFKIFRVTAGSGADKIFSSNGSFWNDLKWNAFVKFTSVFNCFSFGNYYINVIFYSFIAFFGVVAIYKVMQHHLKLPQAGLIIACFLIPSFIYWCSGFHKDGITFLALGIIIYNVYFGILKNKFTIKSCMAILLGVFILFIFRNHVLLVLLPALLAWIISQKFSIQPVKVFAFTYIICGICFFTLKHISPALDFPAIVAEKRDAFMSLAGGNTSVPVSKLEPTFAGFMKKLPHAISVSAFRPYLNDANKPLILSAFIELVFIWALIIFSFFFYRKKNRFTGFGLFITFFSISVIIMIGYSVNNLGAVARYRSILFPLFMPFILSRINWKKANLYIKYFKYKK